MAAVDGLPGPLAAGLLDGARGAFAQALQATALTSAVLVVATAALVLVFLGPTRAGAEAEGRAAAEPTPEKP